MTYQHIKTNKFFEAKKINEYCGVFYNLDDNLQRVKQTYFESTHPKYNDDKISIIRVENLRVVSNKKQNVLF